MATRDDRIRAERAAASKGGITVAEEEIGGGTSLVPQGTQFNGEETPEKSRFGGPKVRAVDVRSLSRGPQGLFSADGQDEEEAAAEHGAMVTQGGAGSSGSGNPFAAGGSTSLALSHGAGSGSRQALRESVVAGSEFSVADGEGGAKGGTPRAVVEAIQRRQEEGQRADALHGGAPDRGRATAEIPEPRR